MKAVVSYGAPRTISNVEAKPFGAHYVDDETGARYMVNDAERSSLGIHQIEHGNGNLRKIITVTLLKSGSFSTGVGLIQQLDVESARSWAAILIGYCDELETEAADAAKAALARAGGQ